MTPTTVPPRPRYKLGLHPAAPPPEPSRDYTVQQGDSVFLCRIAQIRRRAVAA